MMRFMQWLHRWVSLVLVTQVLLWLASGFYFSISGHHGMSGQQYLAEPSPSPAITLMHADVGFKEMHQRFPEALSINLNTVAGKGQYQVQLADQTLYFDANTGQSWETDGNLATKLALASYNGPGELESVEIVVGSDEINDWNASGFKVSMDDDLNTRIYVDAASGRVLDHRNTPWTIADWAFRVHFMDYSGGRSFNHLLIWSAGLLALWFSLSGLILLGRNIAQGDFNPNRKKTWLEHFQQQGQPIASSCGGGGTCGLCKVTLRGNALPQPTAAEKVMLSPSELSSGLRLSCQHKSSNDYEVELIDDQVRDIELKLEAKRQLTPSIVELTFASSAAVNYEAGQFMQFRIPHMKKVLPRHYSMATKPDTHTLVFNVRQLPSPSEGVPPGVGSNYLCSLAPGSLVEALGPFGDFQLTSRTHSTQVFIGGGAGMAPLRSLIQTELSKETPRECVFFYGARFENELCYRDELEAHSGLSYTPVLSEVEAQDNWPGRTGYVHEVALEWLKTQELESLDVYVCGPPPMLAATLKALAELGVSRNQIRFDDFGI